MKKLYRLKGFKTWTREPMTLELLATTEMEAWLQAESHGLVPQEIEELVPTPEQLRQKADEARKAKDETFARRFAVSDPCSRCGEVIWAFVSLSPTRQAATWQCSYCQKKVISRGESKAVERSKSAREPIPKEVQREVWRRDEGRCVECGSNEKLEYDHIIPLSKGGANTVRNLQLLCEICNRKKSNSIG